MEAKAMEIKNPQYQQLIEVMFNSAAFVKDIGISFFACGPGWCESSMEILPRHLQQAGVVHAGAQATIASHTAGAAATTLLAQDQHALIAEFKINLLRPVTGEGLFCRAQVLKPGKTLIIVEAEVSSSASRTTGTLVSKMTATMSVWAPGNAL